MQVQRTYLLYNTWIIYSIICNFRKKYSFLGIEYGILSCNGKSIDDLFNIPTVYRYYSFLGI